MPTDKDKDKNDIYYASVEERHKPLVRTTITLMFPNLGSSTINEQVSSLVSHAMRCGARETFVTICPEDEQPDE